MPHAAVRRPVPRRRPLAKCNCFLLPVIMFPFRQSGRKNFVAALPLSCRTEDFHDDRSEHHHGRGRKRRGRARDPREKAASPHEESARRKSGSVPAGATRNAGGVRGGARDKSARSGKNIIGNIRRAPSKTAESVSPKIRRKNGSGCGRFRRPRPASR